MRQVLRVSFAVVVSGTISTGLCVLAYLALHSLLLPFSLGLYGVLAFSLLVLWLLTFGAGLRLLGPPAVRTWIAHGWREWLFDLLNSFLGT